MLRLSDERRRQRPKREPAEERAAVHHEIIRASIRMGTSVKDGWRGV
jgi:hypothetical protein